MNFLYPWAFAGLISIPAIIAMYLLKQNYTEYRNSSNFLWAKAASTAFAQKPWQKLRKEILMILQIIAAFLIVLALAGPFAVKEGKAESYILVLDASLSMQAEHESGKSRFDYAKKVLEDTVANAPLNGKFALVVAKKEASVAVNFTNDKKDIINKLKEIEVSNSYAEEEGISRLVTSLYQQSESEVYVFSDYGFNFNNLPVTNFEAGGAADNTAITLMSNSTDADKIVSLVKIKNYGKNVVQNSVALYGDGALIDVKDFQIMAGEETNVFFTNVPLGTKLLMAKLTNADILPIDDIYYDTVQQAGIQKAVIFSERNIFMENVLSLMPSVEVYKGDINNIDNISGYYLYIFDGVLPEELPKDGHLLIFNPPEHNKFIHTEGEQEVSALFVKDSRFLNFIEALDFGISRARVMEEPVWANTVVSSDIGPLIVAGEYNGQKQVIFSFDLHNSDFPLKKEFPIFMHNLVEWFIPQKVYEGDKLVVGQRVHLNTYPSSESIKIVSPLGETYTLAPPFPVGNFSETYSPGFYILEQIVSGEEIYETFAVNIEPGEELNLNKEKVYTSFSGDKEKISLNHYNARNICLILAFVIILAEWYFLNRGKLKIPDFIRTAVIILIILSFIDIDIKARTQNTTTVFAVDMSESFSDNMKGMEKEINAALKNKGNNDIIGSVAFGKNAFINNYPSEDISALTFNSAVNKGFTNISEGLLLASTVIPENSAKRIVLISDGKENLGDVYQTARILAEQSISVDVYYAESNFSDEVQVSKINVPKNLNKGSVYNIDVSIYSLSENSGRLLVYKNDKLIVSQEVPIKQGENRFVFSDTADEGGNIIYKAVIEPLKDSIYENNIAYNYSFVEDIPNVLIISYENSGTEVGAIAEASGVNCHVVDVKQVPAELEWINAYDTVVLADISVDDMEKDMDKVLESYTKSGGGVIVTGGENSFALGGYHKTGLEELLPVTMELKDESELPNQGMIIVLDRSGSMGSGKYGISKLELAKEAVIRSVDVLSSEDYFGVLAFDTENLWVSEYEKIPNNKEGITENVASITLGGGTAILPALEEAYNTLKSSDTKLKHIILLTDGQDTDQGYTALIQRMKEEGITLSTVSIGSDADIALLRRIAEDAGGRYYYTDEFTDLPKIFTKETFMAGKKYINNEEFYPILGTYTPIMKNIEALPKIGGYIGATAKTRADVSLYSLDDNPLLASWQYGLGRSIAYLSDYSGKWSNMLINTEEGTRLFRNMLSYTLRRQVGADISVEVEIKGEESQIKVQLPYYSENEEIEAKIISPGMEETDIRLKIISPGVYEGSIPFANTGAYLLNLQIKNEDSTEGFVTGFNIPYSPEYDIENMERGEEKLRKVSEITGGRYLTNLENVFEPINKEVYKKLNINFIPAVSALILFLFDIAIRRFPALKHRLRKIVPAISFRNNETHIKIEINEGFPLKEKKVKMQEKENAKGLANASEPKKEDTSNLLLKGKKKRSGR